MAHLVWLAAGAVMGATLVVVVARAAWIPKPARGGRAPEAASAELDGEVLRQERAADRRRVRRARRIARRAERVLVMARCLVGASPRELAARSTRAAVDDFAAETASLWVFAGGRAELFASAARRSAAVGGARWPETATPLTLPPRTERGGSVHYLVLRDEARSPVGCLEVGFSPPRSRRPPGLEAYAALLGRFLAAELARGADITAAGAPAGARAA